MRTHLRFRFLRLNQKKSSHVQIEALGAMKQQMKVRVVMGGMSSNAITALAQIKLSLS